MSLTNEEFNAARRASKTIEYYSRDRGDWFVSDRDYLFPGYEYRIKPEAEQPPVVTPHVHAALIKQWADGATIQWRECAEDEWADCRYSHINWEMDAQYRVKPAREFPKSSLDYGALCAIVNEARGYPPGEGTQTVIARLAANAAVKQYILDSEAKK